MARKGERWLLVEWLDDRAPRDRRYRGGSYRATEVPALLVGLSGVDGVTLDERYTLREAVGGGWMILIDGVQWGPVRDASGAGASEFTHADAIAKVIALALADT